MESPKKQAANILHRNKLQRRWMALFLCLSLVVSTVTATALKLNGQALTNPPRVYACAFAPHAHTAACGDPAACGMATFAVHTHDERCYDDANNLICTMPEIVEHTHGDDCYATVETLTCGLEECEPTEGHTHTDACYTTTAGEAVLACGLEEHTHTDACYTVTTDDEGNETGRELICALAEHAHTDACYTPGEDVRTLTCGLEETPATAGHTHTADCYTTEQALTCTLPEVTLHTHTDECYDIQLDEAGNEVSRTLTCDKLEVLAHQHTDACFKTEDQLAADSDAALDDAEATETEETTPEYICGLTEHTHTDECAALDEEGNAVLDENGDPTYTCGLEEHTHTEECLAPEEETEPELLVRTCQQGDVLVTVEYPVEANIPEEAELRVVEYAPDSEYFAQCEEESGAAIRRLFDIGFYIVNENGEEQEIEPAEGVAVKVTITMAEEQQPEATGDLLHFTDDGIDAVPNDCQNEDGVSTLEFVTDSFSTYAYTEGNTIVIELGERNYTQSGSDTCDKNENGWVSSDSSVVTVENVKLGNYWYGSYSTSAEFAPQKTGTSTITHTFKYKYYGLFGGQRDGTDKWTVRVVQATYLNISGDTDALIGDTITLTPALQDGNKRTISKPAGKYEWKVAEDSEVPADQVTFTKNNNNNNNVKVTSSVGGDVKIVCTYTTPNGKTVTADHVIHFRDVASIAIAGSDTVREGKTIELQATFKDKNGKEITNPANMGTITWSADPAANVELAPFSDGKTCTVNGVTEGDVIITCTYQPKDKDAKPITATHKVTVTTSGTTVNVRELGKEKYLTAKDDGTYDLTLSITGAVGTKTNKALVDVIFVLDTSHSMKRYMNSDGDANNYTQNENSRFYNMIKAAKNAVSILDGEKNKNSMDIQYAMVVYDTKAGITKTWSDSLDGGWPNKTGNYTANDLQAGGTNYEAALIEVQRLLDQKKDDGATKIVIFISDGNPTIYNYDENRVAGNGNSFDQTALDRANSQLKEMTSIDQFYTVGVGPTANYEHLKNLKSDSATINENIEGSDVKKLEEGLSGIATQITNILCSNVTVTDILSENVEMCYEVGGTTPKALKVFVGEKQTDGTVKKIAEGENGSAAFTYKDAEGKTQNVTLKAVYQPGADGTKGQIVMSFKPTTYTLQKDYVYQVTANIQPTDEAYDKWATGNKNDHGTDSNGNEVVGLFSNNGATVTYDYNNTHREEKFPMPAIQLERSQITLTKTNTDGERLENAEFTLAKYNEATGTFEKIDTFKSKTDGTLTIDSANLTTGSYTLTETKAPDETYTATQEVLAFNVEKGKISFTDPAEHSQWIITEKNPAKVGDLHTYTMTVVNSLATADLTITKVGEKGDALKGATFYLLDEDGKELQRAEVTANNGQITFTGLDLTKTYTLVENAAPTGYDNKDMTFTVRRAGTSNEFEIVKVAEDGTEAVVKDKIIVNHKLTVPLQLKKVTNENRETGLAGAEFTLTLPAIGDEAAQQVQLVSGEDGMLHLSENGVVAKEAYQLPVVYGQQYTMQETKAPNGYNLLASGLTITIDGEGNVSAISTKTEGDETTAITFSTIKGANGETVLPIPNSAGHELPKTGGEGVKMYLAAGYVLLVMAAGLWLARRNKNTAR